MDKIPSEAIIIGSGASILPYISLLQPFLATKFAITCNYSYKDFNGTFLCFQDKEFYVPDYAKIYADENALRHPDIYEELKKLPLIVGINDNGIDEFKLDNTILLDKKERENLTGIFALKLAEEIIKEGTIYLLGFDWSRQSIPEDKSKYNPKSNLQIHYYSKNEIKHRGVGYTGYYDRHNADKEFTKLIKKDVKIFNVSLESNITCLEKISYKKFFELLSHQEINQEELRNYIKIRLT